MFGAQVVRDIFLKWESLHLRGHLVWIPMLEADNLSAAIAQEAIYRDERLTQYWDGERALGNMVSRVLALSTPIAWDVYLLYSSAAPWKGGMIPPPDFWMHQLDERPDLRLVPGRLVAEVQQAIDTDPISNSK